MLPKHSSFLNKAEKYVKRRYSQALESDAQNEPTKKLRKIKNGKSENESDDLPFAEDVVNCHSAEFQDFLRHFMIPSNIYKSLAIRHKTNPIILKRNLCYLGSNKQEIQRSDLKTIADHLSTVQFHDENMAVLKGKSPNKLIFPSYPNKVIFKFDQFMDSKTDKDWKTIEAVVYLDIVHFYRDNRKNKEGFIVKRVLPGYMIKCNDDMISEEKAHIIDIADAMKSSTHYRVYKSLFHFKVLAKEKKSYTKQSFIDRKSEEKNHEIFPVTYEAMMPLFSNTTSRNVRSHNYFVQSGKYQIFLSVTNMEKCDDSTYSGVAPTTDVYSSETDPLDSHPLDDCQWYRVDDPQQKIAANKSTKARITFHLENEDDITRDRQKPMQTRNRSLPPILKMSPYKTGELRLSSITLAEKPKIEVNIAYKFVMGDKIVQWTQTKHLSCPWCRLGFDLQLDLFDTFRRLLAHLNNWHTKLSFCCGQLQKSRATFVQEFRHNFITIEVRLADFAKVHDWDFGHALLGAQLPAHRMPLTELIHWRYKKPAAKKRHKNHDRDYSHTWSAEKLKVAEFEIDSESEENMQWLFDQYHRKVEEFSDLNHIEKRVIQMWNRGLLRYGLYLSDTQLKPFVENFVHGIIGDEHQLREVKSMRNTFMLHLVNLVDYGVLSSPVMLQCMKRLDQALERV